MTTHLLWTGGWDSTFRLLNLLLVYQTPVQPYYLIDLDRPGFAAEIAAMARIRDGVVRESPFVADLLAPTLIVERSQLRQDEEVTHAMLRLRGDGRLGLQYDWLIRFARQHCSSPLELSIHRDDKAHAVLDRTVVRHGTETGSSACVGNEPGDLQIFSVFRFPLFDLTKLDMQHEARKAKFGHHLEMTWFCHSPLSNGEPCGTCSPCNYTREEGLGRRIPARGRMREKLGSLGRKIRLVP